MDGTASLEATATGPRCRICGEKVRLSGAAVSESLKRAVHDRSGDEFGPDGHLAVPVDISLAAWS